MSEVIYRKYRPSTFADVINQDHVKRTVQNQIASGNVAHAYLFTGPRGVGKTTIARLIARTVNCQKVKKAEPCNSCESCKAILQGAALDVIEIDAASHTDVDNVRENIIGNVRFAPNQLSYKVFIIDEVHMLSTSAFNALLKTLEEPPAHAIFVLATTEIHKVPETIISRCQRFDFKRVPVGEIVHRMKEIAKAEGVKIDEDVLAEVARHSDGCVRDAESLLGQMFSLGEKNITMESASLVLPATTSVIVLDFLEDVFKKRPAQAIRKLNDYVEQGVDMTHFLDDVIELLRSMLLALLGDTDALSSTLDAQGFARAKELYTDVSAEKLSVAIEQFLFARRHSKSDKIPQLSAELAVISLSEKLDFNAQEVDSVRPKDKNNDPPPSGTGDASPSSTEQSETPVATATVFDTVPVISIHEVKKKWPEFFKQLQEENGTLPVVIQSGRLCDVCEDHVEISFEYEFHAEVINKDKNRQLIESILERVFGKPLRVRAKLEKPEDDETVSGLLKEFGGSVL